jgi:acyl-CoA synthetase (AMP-forming)/AMP-acid ligase II
MYPEMIISPKMNIIRLIEKIKLWKENEAIICNGEIFKYDWMLERLEFWDKKIKKYGIKSGSVVAIIGDYSPEVTVLLISLIKNNNIVVPLTYLFRTNFEELLDIPNVKYIFKFDEKDNFRFEIRNINQTHKLIKKLKVKGRPGLILFSSGTTGEPKVIVHDFEKLLTKHRSANKRLRTLAFLMFDHIAGIDTLFYVLFSGGTLIFSKERSVNCICDLIEKYKVEVLPTSPTFLNLLVISKEYKNYDLTSLKIITFGSEVMPKYLLEKLKSIFCNVKIIQKYGISELGSPPSKSKNDNLLWIKMDSDQFRVKIVDGILFVKAETAMLGYLNAPNPFTYDGWFNTGDKVEVDGEYLKILGRESDIINVGGEKVYPAEVENIIGEIHNVAEVAVYGEKNQIMGNIVCARIKLLKEEDKKIFIRRLKKYCSSKLEIYKVPVKVKITVDKLYSTRFKKKRLV